MRGDADASWTGTLDMFQALDWNRMKHPNRKHIFFFMMAVLAMDRGIFSCK